MFASIIRTDDVVESFLRSIARPAHTQNMWMMYEIRQENVRNARFDGIARLARFARAIERKLIDEDKTYVG